MEVPINCPYCRNLAIPFGPSRSKPFDRPGRTLIRDPSMKNLPADARPREKLLARGAGALSDSELLALLLRTGTAGRGVMQMADELLAEPGKGGFGGISGLLNAGADDLKRIKGMGGSAKRAELVAVMELARRAVGQQLKERDVF